MKVMSSHWLHFARLLLVATVTIALFSHPAQAVTLTSTGISLESDTNGTVHVADGSGTERMIVGGYKLGSSQGQTGGGAASIITVSGKQAIQMVYAMSGTTGTVTVKGIFTPSPYKVHIHYDITGPSTLGLNLAMMRRVIAPTAITPLTKTKLGVWTRDDNDGVPYEESDGFAYTHNYGSLLAALRVPGSNSDWQDANYVHAPAVNTGTGTWTVDSDLVLLNGRPENVGAASAGQPLSLKLWTSTPYNLWNSGTGMSVYSQTLNFSGASKNITLSWWARDFSGTIVGSGTASQNTANGGRWENTLTFPSPTRGILFVEATATDGINTVFARTTLTKLPPHTFQSGSESIFGLAAIFKEPSIANVSSLIKRLGVRWLRFGTELTPAEAATAGVSQNYHSRTPDATLTWSSGDAAARNAWIDGQLANAEAIGAPYWEFMNEMNLQGGVKQGAWAADYATWLGYISARKAATGSNVKVMMGGLAGMDTVFTDKVYNGGGWPKFQALAIHPGRGNYTADYPGENGEISNPDYWNFLGTVRSAKNVLAAKGMKDLFITEAYACTSPNNWWKDTYRHAAENVLLQYAIAQAEGVKVMDFYQLNDGIWSDHGGVSHTNSEYHYGLLNRDFSLKPSALAYATIAEALDKATFVKWMKFSDVKTHGLMFNTPRGVMCVLWHRADGYILSSNTSTYAADEPWVDPWPTKKNITLPASGSTVKVLNCIGEQTTLTPSSGNITLTLDGAPRIVYGLASSAGNPPAGASSKKF